MSGLRLPDVSTCGRSDRFLTAVETGRWHGSNPELLVISIGETHHTHLLKFSLFSLQYQGRTALNQRKPYKYKQVSRCFAYNLGDEQHIKAFLRTFDWISVWSRGSSEPILKVGQRKKISRSEIYLTSDLPNTDEYCGAEELDLYCENRSYRHPDQRFMSRDPEIRRRANEDWKQAKGGVRPKKMFRIRRRLRGKNRWETTKGYAITNGSELTIPYEIAATVVDRTRHLLLWFWSYVADHLDQKSIHRLPAAGRVLIPQLHDRLQPEEEPALRDNPELYRASLDRLCAGATSKRRPLLHDYNPEYVKRLAAYSDGKLRWRNFWLVKEDQAIEDCAWIRFLSATNILEFTKQALQALALSLCVKYITSKTNWRYSSTGFGSGSVNILYIVPSRSRGPPTKNSCAVNIGGSFFSTKRREWIGLSKSKNEPKFTSEMMDNNKHLWIYALQSCRAFSSKGGNFLLDFFASSWYNQYDL